MVLEGVGFLEMGSWGGINRIFRKDFNGRFVEDYVYEFIGIVVEVWER